MMGGNDVVRLGNHGSKVITDVGKIVQLAIDNEDEVFLEKIKEVCEKTLIAKKSN